MPCKDLPAFGICLSVISALALTRVVWADSAPATAVVEGSREELLSIPQHLISNRRGTIQFIINVQSFIDCTGFGASCNCVNSTKPPKLYQLVVDVDFPAGDGPFPITWLWHGFGGPLLLNSRGYNQYVYALNTAGYAVIQYDVIQAFLPILVQDTVELQFPIQVLNWLKFVSQNPASKFYNKFDFSRIAVTGHSRGGKMSAYVYGASLLPGVFAWIGIDPVDCTCQAPCTSNWHWEIGRNLAESVGSVTTYPNSTATLMGKLTAAIGAQIKGCCNPTPAPNYSCTTLGVPCPGIDYQGFLDAGAPGSQLYVSYAGHAQYAQLCAGFGVCNIVGNIVCGANYSVTDRQVQDQSAGYVVQWINSKLPPKPAQTKLPAAARQEGDVITPEELATSAALQTPIDLQEGIDYRFTSNFPEILLQQAYSNLQAVLPDATQVAQAAGRVGQPRDSEPASALVDGAAAPMVEATWPWGG